ncbi:hypothetical protein Purlil1_8807 [Purpureocillium lilacinum]|uniref:Dipeptidase n=3 Tax=Purpureocillium lilacinum TaxID=33203 RepID=A0ABR0BS94_PURLI|nr:hypothetical protein Purlil1_8807 [Purpureocillium lilacinum]
MSLIDVVAALVGAQDNSLARWARRDDERRGPAQAARGCCRLVGRGGLVTAWEIRTRCNVAVGQREPEGGELETKVGGSRWARRGDGMRGEEAVWNGKGGERPGQQRGWTWVALRLVGGSSWMAWVDDDGPECGRSWRRARVGPGLQAWATVSFRRPALLGQGSAAQGAALQSMDTSRHLGMPGAWRGGTSVDERAAWTGAGSSLGLLPLTTEALSTAPLLCPGASRPNVSRRNVGAAWSMLGQVAARPVLGLPVRGRDAQVLGVGAAGCCGLHWRCPGWWWTALQGYGRRARRTRARRWLVALGPPVPVARPGPVSRLPCGNGLVDPAAKVVIVIASVITRRDMAAAGDSFARLPVNYLHGTCAGAILDCISPLGLSGAASAPGPGGHQRQHSVIGTTTGHLIERNGKVGVPVRFGNHAGDPSGLRKLNMSDELPVDVPDAISEFPILTISVLLHSSAGAQPTALDPTWASPSRSQNSAVRLRYPPFLRDTGSIMAAESKLGSLPPHGTADEPLYVESQQPKPSRRLSPSKIVLCVIFALVFVGIPYRPATHYYHRASNHVCQKFMSIEQRARRILDRNPLIDGHVDLAIALRFLYGNRIDNAGFLESFRNGTSPGQVDLHRLRQGQAGGAFWSVFAPCPEDALSEEQLAPIVQYTLDQIDVTARVLESFPNDFAQKPDSASALRAFSEGKIISPMGVEGLHQIGNSATNLRLFRDLGVRYATLTHNCHNKYADAAVVEHPLAKSKPHWGGVSGEGRKMVHEMNRIGMIVDISHVSDDTMVDVLGGKDGWEGSKAPVIFSHSSAWSICPHPRNVKDHVLDLVKKRNSLVMVNINPGFISCKDVGNENGLPEDDYEHANLDQIVKHILHIGNRIGYDHVGIGTDLDGIEDLPEGFRDVTNYPDLVAALLKAGVSDADAAKVVGRNLLRVWREVDAVSAKMKAEGAPVLEDKIKA